MSNLIQFLERNEQLAKEAFQQKTKELEEIIAIKEGDLSIEYRQRQRAEQRVSELERQLAQLTTSRREMDERRLQSQNRQSERRWDQERGKLVDELSRSEKRIATLADENKELTQRVEELEKASHAKDQSVKDIIEKLNRANMELKRLEVSFLQSEQINDGLKKQFQEMGELGEKQKAKIDELGKLVELEAVKAANLEKQNQVLNLEVDNMKKQLGGESNRRVKLEEQLEELRQKSASGTPSGQGITSLDQLRPIPTPQERVPPISKRASQQNADLFRREESFQKIQWEPQAKAQTTEMKDDKPPNQNRKAGALDMHKPNEKAPMSFEGANHYSLSNQRLAATDMPGPAKIVKYSAPYQSNRRASQNSYFRLNRSGAHEPISRLGRTVSPSPVRRIKLEDRRIISSQTPSSNRRFISKIYSSTEKRFVPADATRTQSNMQSTSGATKRIVKQSIRTTNPLTRDNSQSRNDSERVYYVVNGPGNGQRQPGTVGKVGELLDQIKSNIEEDKFGLTKQSNEKYEISELSSYGPSQTQSELRQEPVEVYNLQFFPRGGQMQKAAKSKTLDNLAPSQSSHRYTRKKMQTSPNFAEYRETPSNVKSPNQLSTRLEDSEFDSDEESEMNFMVRNEPDVESQFEIFKNQIKENFSRRKSQARESHLRRDESPGLLGNS